MAWDLTDEYGRKTGRVSDDGRITDEYGRNAGRYDASTGRITDEYGRTMGWCNSDGRLTNEYGRTTGHVNTDGRITNEYGRTTGHYRQGSDCYLTSACVEFRGMADDCDLLNKLRAFRDGYMSSFDEGKTDVEKYYATAPAIVAAIDASPECVRKSAYDAIFAVVEKCAGLIDAGRNEEAYEEYKRMTKELEGAFC